VKRSEAAKIFAMLAGAFPGASTSEATARVYEQFLLDLDAKFAEAAVVRLISTCKFLPTIAEIRGMVNDVHRGPMRTGDEAWGDVVRAIRDVGSYRMPKFDDPLTAYAVGRLGWRNLCLDGTNDASDRARFAEIYDAAAGRQRQDEVVGQALPARHAEALPAPVTGLLAAIGTGGRR
jgi:hypothetical protein